jgi:protein required for attachment to host cells
MDLTLRRAKRFVQNKLRGLPRLGALRRSYNKATKSVMTFALIPALSPRRGGNVRRVLSHAIGWVILRLTAKDTESVTAMRIEKLSSNVRCSPSPRGRGPG